MICPGGPHFPVDEGVTLTGGSWDQVYAMISEYRMQHGKEPGDPRGDCVKYICGKWPRFCILEKEGAPASEQGRSMGSRLNGWVAMAIRNQPPGGYELVTQAEANDRAEICAQCPMNLGWITCPNCAEATQGLSARIRRLRNTPIDNQLSGCLVFGHDNQSAVHLAQHIPPLTDATKELAPPGCWKLKIK